MLVAMMLILASPNPKTLDPPRKAYAACIRQFEAKSAEAKISAASYSSAIKTACQAEATALMNALIAYDVAMGGKRATAASTAASDVADYVLTSEERYKDMVPPQ